MTDKGRIRIIAADDPDLARDVRARHRLRAAEHRRRAAERHTDRVLTLWLTVGPPTRTPHRDDFPNERDPQ